jgi:glycosyltransferase involved in cell wall biosynthesis
MAKSRHASPKIAVYTIALNEEQFVERWYESAKEADYLLIADTGSTDGTRETAIKLGINVIDVSVKPWRFDDARNASLAVLPEDIDLCIALDMDEVLVGDWRGQLELAHEQQINRPTYRFITSWDKFGNPSMEFEGFRIHSRHGYRWKFPIHELPTPYGIVEKRLRMDFEVHHLPDQAKTRSQYLPLLKMAVDEDPQSDRNSFYYARELFFHKMYPEAASEFKRHLSLPSAWWKPQRAASMRYLAKCEPSDASQWLNKAVEEDPGRREQLVELAQISYSEKDWETCFKLAEKALSIQEKPLDYFCEGFAWGDLPYDLAAISAYNLGDYKSAYRYGVIAAGLAPEDERIQTNLEFYHSKVYPSSL